MNVYQGADAARAASANSIGLPASAGQTGKPFYLLPVPMPALPEWQRRVADWMRS